MARRLNRLHHIPARVVEAAVLAVWGLPLKGRRIVELLDDVDAPRLQGPAHAPL
ncbi:hypothetical protein ABGB14_37755 [Nonomuraea sp. B10E15]|uniref:hypothetical protein n=1 Tax=Nonomuraea sp. B10E15 TaxID=3153560 RepID=UPI00325F013F